MSGKLKYIICPTQTSCSYCAHYFFGSISFVILCCCCCALNTNFQPLLVKPLRAHPVCFFLSF